MGINGQYDPQDLERVQKFRYMDDDFMTACFDENYEAVELVLRIVMGKSDLKVQALNVQRLLKNLHGRSAIIDVHAIDSKKREYDIEIQRSDAGAGAKRARHNSSLLDAHILKPGEEPEDLPESYVIFITQNDVMKGKQAIYPIDRYVTIGNEKVLFGDGSHILYVNGEYRGSDDIGKLMHDFSCEDPDDMNYEELAKKARYFKRDEKGVEVMCKMMEDMRKEAAKEAAKEATEEAVKKMAIRMLETGTYPMEEIARISGLTLEEVKNLKVPAMA